MKTHIIRLVPESPSLSLNYCIVFLIHSESISWVPVWMLGTVGGQISGKWVSCVPCSWELMVWWVVAIKYFSERWYDYLLLMALMSIKGLNNIFLFFIWTIYSFPLQKYNQPFCLPDLKWGDKMYIRICDDTATNIILYADSLSELKIFNVVSLSHSHSDFIIMWSSWDDWF